MKNCFLISILLAFVSVINAQNVGIGVSSPTQKLDVAGNLKFSGALMPNGSAGNAYDVLMSGGAAPNAPTWGNPVAGQTWTTVYTTDSVNLTYNASLPHLSLPGLSVTITVPSTGTFDAFIYTDGGIQWMANKDSDNNSIETDVSIWVDGGSGGFGQRYQSVVVDNTSNFGQGLRNWSFAYGVQNISGGQHTFEVKGRVRQDPSPDSPTATFGDPNTSGKIRVGSLSVVLIRK